MADKAPDVRVTHIEDDGVTFPVLTINKIEIIEQAIKKDLIAHYAELGEAAGITAPEKMAFLKEAIPETVSINDIFAWAQTSRGVRRILTESIGDKPDIIQKYVGLNGSNMAMAVMGYAKRQTEIEIEALRKEIADRLSGLYQQEKAFEARKAALELAENGVEPEAAEKKPFPPGGSGTSE